MLKVVLIEDDRTMLALLSTLIQMEGFEVKALEDDPMDSLLKEIHLERPNLALIDVNLSKGSGLDLVRKIRHDPDIKDTRILMSSGLNVKRECIEAGADGFILKPYMPDDLINLIHKTIK